MSRQSSHGGSGNDTLLGGAAGDGMFGGEGNDKLVAHGGNDVMNGDQGDDLLVGGDGNDGCAAMTAMTISLAATARIV